MTNLAVVGAGIGGCSVAYFASRYLPDSKVTVYETEKRVGGRVLTFKYEEMKNELGAAFINSSNKIVCQLIKETGLQVKKLEEISDIAVWNGTDIVFKSNQSSFYKILKLASNYRLNVPKLLLTLKEADKKIKELYKKEENKPAEFWELFESVDLDIYYKRRFNEILAEKGINQKFIDEIITPVTRIIYSQNATLGGFAGLSALLGVYEKAVFSLKDGNDILPKKLLELSNAKFEPDSKVKSLEKTSKGSFRVFTGKKTKIFDAVIIAAPLEVANIDFEGIEKQKMQTRDYQKIYIRLMKGQVNSKYFNLNSSKLPSVILTTKQADPIIRFSINKSTKNDEHWVAVTSTEQLNDGFFDDLFKNGKIVLNHTWNAAYPIFKPIQQISPTCLDKRLLYLNSIESAVSSLESSTFSALNSIKMIKKQLLS
jgi:prenylcysteine oxidase/farnesylcysteine lyase